MLKKYNYCFLLLGVCLQFCGLFAQSNKEVTILLKHNAVIPQPGYIASIAWKDILKKYPSVDTSNFTVVAHSSNKEVIFQLEYLGKSEPQNLLIQVDLVPGKSEKYIIKHSPHLNFISQTYCRYVPERKDDFAWENDKIAFRIYGKALEGTNENANGIDVWVKRTNNLVINNRYKRADYHTDHGDGLDYYHVGLTLGAGNIAPYVSDSIYFPKNYQTWKILDNGPIRSTFELTYDNWNVAGTPIGMTKTISIDAGSQLSRIAVKFSSASRVSLPVVVGITMRKEQGDHYFDKVKGIMAYWEPADPAFGTTGVGCIFLDPVKSMLIAKEHLLTQFIVKTNSTFSYLSGAAWDRANEITNANSWYEYLTAQKKKLGIKVNAVIY